MSNYFNLIEIIKILSRIIYVQVIKIWIPLSKIYMHFSSSVFFFDKKKSGLLSILDIIKEIVDIKGE